MTVAPTSKRRDTIQASWTGRLPATVTGLGKATVRLSVYRGKLLCITCQLNLFGQRTKRVCQSFTIAI